MPATLHIYVSLHCYCNLHIDPTFLHISVKPQQNETLIYYSIAIYVPATNMPLKWHLLATSQITQCASIGELCKYIYHI